MLDHVHGEAVLAGFVQRRHERESEHHPAGQEQSGAGRPNGRAAGQPHPPGHKDQQRETERHEQHRIERPAYAHTHAQHGGITSAAINGSTTASANSAAAISETAAINRRAGASRSDWNTGNEINAPAAMMSRPTMVPIITIQGLPARQFWKVASEPN